MKRTRIAALLLALVSSFIAVPSAYAASNCAPLELGNKAAGEIQVGSMVVDVARISYKPGGEVLPPSSPLIAGISILHQPLKATMGSSLIVWHDYWSGCYGSLNVLATKKPGFKFVVRDETGKKRVFAISKILTVKMGDYKNEWFSLNGPRQLIMVTCTGKLVGGHKVFNKVVIANPVL